MKNWKTIVLNEDNTLFNPQQEIKMIFDFSENIIYLDIRGLIDLDAMETTRANWKIGKLYK